MNARSGAGSGMLNNPGREYYNNAGIMGSQSSNPYAIGGNQGSQLKGLGGGINSSAMAPA